MTTNMTTSVRDEKSRNPRRFFGWWVRLFQARGSWRRFFTLYLTIPIVFLLLFGLFVNTTTTLLTNQAVRTTQEMLSSGMKRLDMSLESYQSAALSLYENSQLIRYPAYDPADKNFNTYQVVVELTLFPSVIRYLPLRTTCGMLCKNGMVMTNARFFKDPQSFWSQFMYCEGFADYGGWREFLMAGGSSALLPERTYQEYGGISYKALTWTMVLPINQPGAGTVFFVTMKSDELLDMLLPADSLAVRRLVLRDKDGNMLLSAGEERETEDPRAPRIWAAGRGGLRVELELDREAYAAQLTPFRRFVTLFVLVYMLSGVALALLGAYRSNKPLLQLLRLIQSGNIQGGVRETRTLTQEHLFILDTLQRQGIALEAYKAELSNQTGQMRYYILSSLLEGTADVMESEALIRQYYAELWEMGRGPFFMMLLRAKGQGEAQGVSTATLLHPLLKDSLPEGSLIASIHHQESDLSRVEVVALVRDSGDGGLRARCASQAGAALRALEDVSCRIAVSEVCGGLRELRDTYGQLSHLLRLSAETESGQAVLLRSREDARRDGPRSAARWESLPPISSASVYRLLAGGQDGTLLQLLDECRNYVNAAFPADESLLRYVFYACTSALHELEGNIPGTVPQIPEYSAQTEVDALFDELSQAVSEACRGVEAYYAASRSELAQKVMQYIDQNVTNPNLYVKMVTDHFQISEPTLQAIIRDASGQSFFNYVEQMRMKKALLLVRETDMMISGICTDCGYVTRTTFFRAFQKSYGMSPKKMREEGMRK